MVFHDLGRAANRSATEQGGCHDDDDDDARDRYDFGVSSATATATADRSGLSGLVCQHGRIQ